MWKLRLLIVVETIDGLELVEGVDEVVVLEADRDEEPAEVTELAGLEEVEEAEDEEVPVVDDLLERATYAVAPATAIITIKTMAITAGAMALLVRIIKPSLGCFRKIGI